MNKFTSKIPTCNHCPITKNDRLTPMDFNKLESLYSDHLDQLNQLKYDDNIKIQISFYRYISFVYETLEIKKPENFENNFEVKNNRKNSNSSKPKSENEKPSHIKQIDPSPNPTSGEEFYELVKKSPNMLIFRTVLLKIMCDEPILMDDLLKFSDSQLFNLQKIVFVKFKIVIDTK